MTSAPWTPGPWTVHKSRTTDDVGIIGGGGCLAECFSEIRRKNENAVREQEANAHLIAAAPTMADYVKRRADEGCEEAASIWEQINAR